ncbi:MAG: CBS domain-containing protein [Thermoprotei archaeon]
MPKAEKIMKEPRSLVRESESLLEALRVASRENLTKVLVVSEDSTLFGYLDLESLVRTFIDPEAEVRQYARKAKRLGIGKDSDAFDALRILHKFGLGVAPLVDNGRVVGEVRRLDVIRSVLAETAATPANEALTGLARDNVAVVAPDDTLVRARLLMAVNGISAIPVVKNDSLVGVVRLNDLLLKLYESFSRGYDAHVVNGAISEKGLMREAYTASVRSTLYEVVAKEGFAVACRAFFESNGIKVLTAGDIIRKLARELGVSEGIVLTSFANFSPDLTESLRDLARTYAERLRRFAGVDDLTVDLKRERFYSVKIRARTAREEDVETEASERDPLKALKLAFERLEDKLKNLKEIKTREPNSSKG